MATIEEVLSWRPARLGSVADGLAGQRRALMSLQDEVDAGAVPGGWEGSAARAAKENVRAIRLELNDRVAGVTAATRALDIGAEAIGNARELLEGALQVATTQGFTVDRATGTVTDARDVPEAEHAAADRQRLCDEICDHIEQARAAAEHADVELAQALDRVVAEVEGGAGDLASARGLGREAGGRDLLRPPQDGRPGDFTAWWEGLTDGEKREVIAEHPGWIGNVDGIPGYARHQANVNLIDDHRENLEERLADAPPQPPITDPDAWLAWREEYGHLQNKLDGLDSIEQLLREHPDDRQLLVLDVTGSHQLKAAVAIGDVDTADHVSVFTPGLTSTVAGSLASYDTEMEHLLEQSGKFADANGDGEADTFAGVVWMGYEAPQLDETVVDLDRSVASDHLAREGAGDLARFYTGLDAMRTDDPHLTALGHSYGSLTTGLALQESTGVDEAVFFGSPGLGTDDLGDLDVPEGHSYYLEAKDDPVGDFARFGRDPSLMDGMQHLSSDGHTGADGTTYDGVTGHSSYFANDSTSQLNMSAVLAGEHDQLVDSPRGPERHEYVIDGVRTGYQETTEFVGDRAEDVRQGAEAVHDWGSERVDDVRDGAGAVRDWGADRVDDVRDGAGAVRDWGSDRVDDVQEGADEVRDFGEDRVEDLEDAGGWLKDKLGG